MKGGSISRFQAILVHSPLGAQTIAVATTAQPSETLDAPTDDTAIAGAAPPNFVVKNQAGGFAHIRAYG